MSYYVVKLLPKADDDLRFWLKSGQHIVVKKIRRLLEELRTHPHTGKPEPLKHSRVGQWSREITKKDRMVYTVKDNIVEVEVISMLGHYD